MTVLDQASAVPQQASPGSIRPAISQASWGPFTIGYLKDATGVNSIGMYFLAAALVVGCIATPSVPAKMVNR